MEYSILDTAGKAVGKAVVEPAGLYWQIVCRCELPADRRWHIRVQSDSGVTDLGICVPRDGCVGLYTCLPAKRLGVRDFSFCVAEDQGEMQQNFYPLHNGQPCPWIGRLRTGRLAVCKGTAGVILKGDLQAYGAVI